MTVPMEQRAAVFRFVAAHLALGELRLGRQNGVVVKPPSHQPRQRATVRRSTLTVSASLSSRRSVSPSRIAEISVTITAR